MRYWPPPSVTTVRTFSMSAGLAASTVTPGSTAPDASRTTPAIDAWAKRGGGSQNQQDHGDERAADDLTWHGPLLGRHRQRRRRERTLKARPLKVRIRG